MKPKVEEFGDVAVITLPMTTLDASTVGEFEREILPLLKTRTRWVMDMSNLEFVDSSGLGMFMRCLRPLRAAGGDLKLFGMTKPVRTIFELVRFHRIIEIYNTQEEAIRAFQG